jgi:hypothetical protein
MIKGKLKHEYLTTEEIYELTNGGFDIYMHYLGKVRRAMKRPWGRDTKESWGIYPYHGTWHWKDFAKEECGTAVQFVERFFHMTLGEAKDKICRDFHLYDNKVYTLGSPVVTWDAPDMEKDYCTINFDTKPFEKQHHEFWNIVEVSEKFCNFLQCWAVKDLAINKRRVHIKEGEAVFAFYAPEEDAVKIYFPERERSKRFRNNVSYEYLWNYNYLKTDRDCIIIQKSPKDMIVTAMIEPSVIATQSESVKVFTPEVVTKIEEVSKNAILFYGSDADGREKAQKIITNTGWKDMHVSEEYLAMNVNDVYSWVKWYNSGGAINTGGLEKVKNYIDKIKTQEK